MWHRNPLGARIPPVHWHNERSLAKAIIIDTFESLVGVGESDFPSSMENQ